VSTIRLGAISLDCADPGPLSTFWARLLGGEIAFTSDDVVVVRLDHLLLTAMRIENYRPPTWPTGPVPKQGHIDLQVDDLDDAERRAISLGAVRGSSQPEPEIYRTFLDPAGHPFCLSTDFPWPPLAGE
jgi:hypothetical protein